MSLVERLRQYRIWLVNGTLAILDQAINSGTSFAISILLARNLSAGDYGAYTLVYSALLFLSGFHNPLVLEPLSVFGPGKYHGRMRSYVGALLKWQVVLFGGLSVVSVCAILVMYKHLPAAWRGDALGAVIAAPLIFGAWFIRRVFYVVHQPAAASVNSMVQSLVGLVGTLFCIYAFRFSGLQAFLTLGLGALVGAITGMVRFGPAITWNLRPDELDRSLLRDHWRYGKWGLLTSIVFWISSNGYTALTGAFVGISDLAGLRAMQNVVAPIGAALTALGTLALPYMAKQYRSAGYQGLQKSIWLVSLGFALLVLVTFGPVALVGSAVDNLLYAGKYGAYAWLLPYLVVSQGVGAMTIGPILAMQAAESPRNVFYGYAASAVTTLLVGVPAIHFWQLGGVAVSGILGQLVLVVVFFHQWRRLLTKLTETAKG